MATTAEAAMAARVSELRRNGVPEAEAIRQAHAKPGVQMPPKIQTAGATPPAKVQMPPQRPPTLEQALMRRRLGQEPEPLQAQGIIATQ